MRSKEKGKLKDISNFEINENDVNNLIKLKKNFDNFDRYIGFCLSSYNLEDLPFIDPYPGFNNIYDFELFFSKLNIKYKEFNYYSDSDSDSDYI